MSFFANTNFLITLSVILCCSLPNVTIFADDGERIQQVKRVDGYPVIVLDKETQQISGLQVIETLPANYRPEFIVFGKAVNIQPLLVLRNRYLQALTERNSAEAKFTQSEQSVKRMQDLFRHGVAAKRRLQAQQSQWQVDRSQVDATHFQVQAVVDEARLNWGKPLTDWAMTADSDKLDAFLSGQQTLLQITLPSNRQLADDVQTIYVEASGDRSKAQEAGLISMNPQIDNTVQGVSYFFRTQGKAIRTGMSVSAWIPEKKDSVPGVIIPKSALIWSMDQVFVYMKTGEEQFSRRMIGLAAPTADGYFIREGIKPGEHVVSTGGQMLLSEELRGQIPDGDD